MSHSEKYTSNDSLWNASSGTESDVPTISKMRNLRTYDDEEFDDEQLRRELLIKKSKTDEVVKNKEIENMRMQTKKMIDESKSILEKSLKEARIKFIENNQNSLLEDDQIELLERIEKVNLECKLCQKKLVDVVDLVRHLRGENHKGRLKNNKKNSCLVCCKNGMKPRAAIKHLRSEEHDKCILFNHLHALNRYETEDCGYCAFRSSNIHSILEHFLSDTHERNVKNSDVCRFMKVFSVANKPPRSNLKSGSIEAEEKQIINKSSRDKHSYLNSSIYENFEHKVYKSGGKPKCKLCNFKLPDDGFEVAKHLKSYQHCKNLQKNSASSFSEQPIEVDDSKYEEFWEDFEKISGDLEKLVSESHEKSEYYDLKVYCNEGDTREVVIAPSGNNVDRFKFKSSEKHSTEVTYLVSGNIFEGRKVDNSRESTPKISPPIANQEFSENSRSTDLTAEMEASGSKDSSLDIFGTNSCKGNRPVEQGIVFSGCKSFEKISPLRNSGEKMDVQELIEESCKDENISIPSSHCEGKYTQEVISTSAEHKEREFDDSNHNMAENVTSVNYESPNILEAVPALEQSISLIKDYEDIQNSEYANTLKSEVSNDHAIETNIDEVTGSEHGNFCLAGIKVDKSVETTYEILRPKIHCHEKIHNNDKILDIQPEKEQTSTPSQEKYLVKGSSLNMDLWNNNEESRLTENDSKRNGCCKITSSNYLNMADSSVGEQNITTNSKSISLDLTVCSLEEFDLFQLSPDN